LTPFIAFGASPRATLGLVAASRALALMRRRRYVLPRDVFDVAADVLRHRLVLSYEAMASEVTAERVVRQVLSTVWAPQITPGQNGNIGDVGVGSAAEETGSRVMAS
jgi:MoxR-like ATPase